MSETEAKWQSIIDLIIPHTTATSAYPARKWHLALTAHTS